MRAAHCIELSIESVSIPFAARSRLISASSSFSIASASSASVGEGGEEAADAWDWEDSWLEEEAGGLAALGEEGGSALSEAVLL